MGLLDFLTGNQGWLGSLINGAASIGTTAMGINAAKDQQAREQSFNAEQAAINRAFQSDEAAIARDFNAREAALNRGFQTSERESAQAFNKEMWNLENEYNSPQAQLERAMAAGMNPNMVIGGMSNAGQAGTVRSSGQSGSAASAPGIPGGSTAQTGSIAGSIAELIGNSSSTFWQNELVKSQAEGQNIQNDYDRATYDDRVAAVKVNKDLIMSQLHLNEQQWKQMEELFPVTLSKSSQEIQLMKQQMTHLINEDKKLLSEIETEKKRQNQIDAETDLTKAQTVTENTLRDDREANLIADTRLKGQETRLTASKNREMLWKEGLRDIGFDPESGIGSNIMRTIYENPESEGAGAEAVMGALDNISTVVEIGSYFAGIGVVSKIGKFAFKGARTAGKFWKGLKSTKAAKKVSKQIDRAAEAAERATTGHSGWY